MGIVVLVVTVLPSLRASGLGLIDAEAPGMGVDRLAPRVRDTAIRFWRLYLGLTVLIAVGFLLAGMGPFDAVAHALTTASTGGFSTQDASIGYWNSVAVESVLIVALILAAANFTLHSRSWSRKRITHFGDHELTLIHISEPTRPERTSYAVFCLKKKKGLAVSPPLSPVILGFLFPSSCLSPT